VLIKCGLLGDDVATLAWNTSGRFEDRWVRLSVEESGVRGQESAKCVFLSGIEQMYLPVAHGEGRFVARDDSTLKQLLAGGQLALRYAPQATNGALSTSHNELLPYPENPNGAQLNVAGMCDATGRIFGLMPHPERHVDRTQHPRWTRGEAGEVGDGLRLFQNAVRFFQ
jgi:phosphoribosylformylglycinamidine synthase subunit PurQ / glutaminase